MLLVTGSFLHASGAVARGDDSATLASYCSLLDGREIVLGAHAFPDVPAFEKKSVELELRVMQDGTISDVTVLQSSSFPELDDLAINEARKHGCNALPEASPLAGALTRVHLNIWRAADEKYVRYKSAADLASRGEVIGNPSHKQEISRGPLPYDKTYGELSPQQKAMVRSEYENLGENDEPPYPKDGLGKVLDVIGRIQHRALVQGEMVLIVRVDEHGDGQSVSVYKTPDPTVSQVVGSALMLGKFKPGTCAGKPCAMDYRFDFKFDVR